MPTAKRKISSHITGLELHFELKKALTEKNYKAMTAVGLSYLLNITVSDAIALMDGRRPSIEAVHKALCFILEAPPLPVPFVIPAQPVVNFCPSEVVYATRI